MAACLIVVDEKLPDLLTALEKSFAINLCRENSHESSIGTIYLFFEGDTPLCQLKITGFTDNWLPEQFDLHITGTEEQNRLFCIAIDNWSGSVLQRSAWV